MGQQKFVLALVIPTKNMNLKFYQCLPLFRSPRFGYAGMTCEIRLVNKFIGEVTHHASTSLKKKLFRSRLK